MPEQVSGALDITNASGDVTIRLNGNDGTIKVFDTSGNTLYEYRRSVAASFIGGTGNEGDVIVRDQNNKERIKLDGGDGDIWVKDPAGKTWMHFDSTFAALWLGGTGNEGDLIVRDAANKERIKLDGGDGDIWVKDPAGRTWFHFDSTFAALWIGGTGNEGDVIVRDQNNRETIKLDGGMGDIILSNADIAEDFSIANPLSAGAGSVMIVGDDGHLAPCTEPYDSRVVGVVSCAGRYRPGMVLDRQTGHDGHRVPISIMGKVACKVSTEHGPISIGDMLTTSPTSGHAMRATDSSRSMGAIIGKALSPVDEDAGLVDMIVSLQ